MSIRRELQPGRPDSKPKLVDPKTGIVLEKGHPLEGKCVAGRVLVFPRGKGSTVGSYVMLGLKKNGVAPAAIINQDAETIIAVGAIISEIPMVDKPEKDIFEVLGEGMGIEVDGGKGKIRLIGRYSKWEI